MSGQKIRKSNWVISFNNNNTAQVKINDVVEVNLESALGKVLSLETVTSEQYWFPWSSINSVYTSYEPSPADKENKWRE